MGRFKKHKPLTERQTAVMLLAKRNRTIAHGDPITKTIPNGVFRSLCIKQYLRSTLEGWEIDNDGGGQS